MKKALIIGISNYNHLDRLDFSDNDALAISEILNKNQYQIYEWNKLIGKINYDTLRDGIIDYFSDQTIDPEDTLIFYFSGHGLVDSDGEVYLASSEIDADNPIKRGLSFRELTNIINKCKSKTIIIILDCCYSGAASFSKGNLKNQANMATTRIENDFSANLRGEGKCLLAACQAYNLAWTLDGEYSLFTSNLIKGLKGEQFSVDIDGNVTVESLGNYVYNNMMRESDVKQKPITKFEGSGKIVIVSYPEKTKKRQKFLDSALLMDQINKNLTDGEYNKALEKLDQVIKINPDYARAYYLKGFIYKNSLQDYEKALNFFEISLNKDYNNDETWYEKGLLLSNDYYKKYNDAVNCFNKAIEFNQKHENALNEKRRTLEKKETDNTLAQKNTNHESPKINILDIRCSNNKSGMVHIIFNVSGIRHGSKDTNYIVNVTDSSGNIFHTHNGKIVKKAPNPGQECITYTLPLRKGSYIITFKINSVVVNKEFETLNC